MEDLIWEEDLMEDIMEEDIMAEGITEGTIDSFKIWFFC